MAARRRSSAVAEPTLFDVEPNATAPVEKPRVVLVVWGNESDCTEIPKAERKPHQEASAVWGAARFAAQRRNDVFLDTVNFGKAADVIQFIGHEVARVIFIVDLERRKNRNLSELEELIRLQRERKIKVDKVLVFVRGEHSSWGKIYSKLKNALQRLAAVSAHGKGPREEAFDAARRVLMAEIG